MYSFIDSFTTYILWDDLYEKNYETIKLKNACAWRPTVYKRETDISIGKWVKVLRH